MSASISTRLHARWLPALLRGQPHEVIGDLDAPYLKRWHLIPPNRHLNVYLHHFCRSDEPGALHDHPWDFASLLIAGRYLEVTDTAATVRSPGSLALRRAEHRHRIRLFTDGHGTPQPCWTLVITGPRRRQWGFWCPTGAGARRFVPWQIYGTPNPPRRQPQRTGHDDLPLRAALHARIPELADDLIEIVAVARDPGRRAKVAVRARVPGVNPVGACIGWGGLRISDVEKRLNGERVSIVAYDPDPATFVASALAVPSATAHITNPAHHEIQVCVDADDYPRALGKYGHNLRLAGELTHWRIHLQANDIPAPTPVTANPQLVATP